MINILIFAKYPEAGKAKTRLAKGVGFEKSAEIAEKLLTTTLVNVSEISNDDIKATVFVSPKPDDVLWQNYQTKLFSQFPNTKKLNWITQSEGDLGDRLKNSANFVRNTIDASSKGSIKQPALIFIGTDCPALTADKLHDSINELKKSDAVLIPADDGGYVLLGMNDYDDSVFTDITWSTEVVAEQTIERITTLDWSLSLLPPETDIDHVEDLAKYDIEALLSVMTA